MELDSKEVSIVANAIGFAIYGNDGRPRMPLEDNEQIDVSPEEAELCKAAAERTLTHLAKYRQRKRPFEDCWSGPMIKELVDAGIVPPWTQRVIIDLQSDHFAMMHILAPPTGEQSEKIIDIIAANVKPAEVTHVER